MRIYIDVTVLTLATFVTGIQRVTREIAVRLIADGGDEVILLHYNAKENAYHTIDNGRFCDFYLRKKGAKSKMITKKTVPLAEIGAGAVFFDLDAAWMCRVKRSWLLPILKRQGARIVAHVYDIISVTHPQFCLERGVYNFMDFIGAHLQYADRIIVNAQATAEELRRLAERTGTSLPPCAVVPLGADFVKMSAEEEKIPRRLEEIVREGPYILMVGTVEPRKNHRLLLEAYDRGLRDMGCRIVMAGYMGWNMEEFARRLHAHPDFGTGIFHLEGLDDAAIACLYRHALFLAFCSYTEGFGLPLIEGILRGTPVLASDIPVSREVAGDYCLWFEQDRPEQICELVREYREDAERYRALKEKLSQFRPVSWKECAERMGEALKTVF